MSYIVFARKYRPQTFDGVIGQSHITTTLKNAIAQGRVAHAYIFAGPRGVGKTTTARILAKALNCEKGPSPEPCNSCASCNEITQGTSLDILEIDGASNRGIEEIRGLRENVKFAPSKGSFRVYIIDEIHMLTAEAFNALLKTLEEPPAHVKFVFATTQPHKIPPTILSRCQRFDFRRISRTDIFKNLKDIADTEGLSVSDEALALIAKYADGSMRDGQVIFDQMTAFAKGRIEAQDVTKILGLVGQDILHEFSGYIKSKDAASAVKMVGRLIDEGKEAGQIALGLVEHFRNIVMIKIGSDLNSLVGVSPEELKRYEEKAAKFSVEELLYIIYTLTNVMASMKKSGLSRIPFEVGLIKLTRMGSFASLAEVLDRLDRLENQTTETKDSPVVKPEADSTLKKTEKDPDKREMPETAGLGEVVSGWNKLVNHLNAKKPYAALYLQEGDPLKVENGILYIGFPKGSGFHKETLETPECRRLIELAIKEALGLELRIELVLSEYVKPKEEAITEDSLPNAAQGPPAEGSDSRKEIEPIIKSAVELFEGGILKRETGQRRPER